MLRASAVVLAAVLAIGLAIGAGLSQPSRAETPSGAAAPPATAAPPAATAAAPEAGTETAKEPDKEPSKEPGKPLATDPFGAEAELPERTVIVLQGTANWDNAFDTLVDAFKSIIGYLDKAGIKPAGPKMVIYTDTDDNGFKFKAAIPIAEAPKDTPQGDLAVEAAPAGKVYKFIHRGPYDSMDNTYEAIANFLDQKGLDVKDLFVEEYVTDPLATAPDELVINVFVPTQ